MTELEFEIEGMTCDRCARDVEAALRRAGASEVSVDWRRGSVSVTEGHVDERAFGEALAGTRYHVEQILRPNRELPASDGRSTHDYDRSQGGACGSAAP